MKKLIVILSLLMVGLSGCFVVPNRGHDDGYRGDHGDRDQRHDDDRDHRNDHQRGDRDGYH